MDAVIFDLDGTIINTLDDLCELTNHVLSEFGMPIHSRDAICQFIGNGALALMVQAVPEGTPQSIVEEALARWKELNPQFTTLSKPYEGIPDTLAKLSEQGVALAVLSNKFDAGVTAMIQAKMPGIFRITRGERPDTPRKPNPTGLLSIISKLGTTSDRCAYVGDTAGDMLTAVNAGCMAIGVSWGYRSVTEMQNAGAHEIIDHPSELLGICLP